MWVDNCIGLNNMRFFLGMLFYLSVLAPLLTVPFYLDFGREEPVSPKIAKVHKAQQIVKFITYLTNTTITIVIVPYTFWNFWLALHGITQVEHTK